MYEMYDSRGEGKEKGFQFKIQADDVVIMEKSVVESQGGIWENNFENRIGIVEKVSGQDDGDELTNDNDDHIARVWWLDPTKKKFRQKGKTENQNIRYLTVIDRFYEIGDGVTLKDYTKQGQITAIKCTQQVRTSEGIDVEINSSDLLLPCSPLSDFATVQLYAGRAPVLCNIEETHLDIIIKMPDGDVCCLLDACNSNTELGELLESSNESAMSPIYQLNFYPSQTIYCPAAFKNYAYYISGRYKKSHERGTIMSIVTAAVTVRAAAVPNDQLKKLNKGGVDTDDEDDADRQLYLVNPSQVSPIASYGCNVIGVGGTGIILTEEQAANPEKINLIQFVTHTSKGKLVKGAERIDRFLDHSITNRNRVGDYKAAFSDSEIRKSTIHALSQTGIVVRTSTQALVKWQDGSSGWIPSIDLDLLHHIQDFDHFPGGLVSPATPFTVDDTFKNHPSNSIQSCYDVKHVGPAFGDLVLYRPHLDDKKQSNEEPWECPLCTLQNTGPRCLACDYISTTGKEQEGDKETVQLLKYDFQPTTLENPKDSSESYVGVVTEITDDNKIVNISWIYSQAPTDPEPRSYHCERGVIAGTITGPGSTLNSFNINWHQHSVPGNKFNSRYKSEFEPPRECPIQDLLCLVDDGDNDEEEEEEEEEEAEETIDWEDRFKPNPKSDTSKAKDSPPTVTEESPVLKRVNSCHEPFGSPDSVCSSSSFSCVDTSDPTPAVEQQQSDNDDGQSPISSAAGSLLSGSVPNGRSSFPAMGDEPTVGPTEDVTVGEPTVEPTEDMAATVSENIAATLSENIAATVSGQFKRMIGSISSIAAGIVGEEDEQNDEQEDEQNDEQEDDEDDEQFKTVPSLLAHSLSTEMDALAPRPNLKRIQTEWKSFSRSLPPGISVIASEQYPQMFRVLIDGPAHTPYYSSSFIFDFLLPHNYPLEPPKVNFLSYGYRLNPNLYIDGRVCLSLLGTWFGYETCERWNPSSTLLQLFISLQGLVLTKEPYYNEAGYHNHLGSLEGRVNSRSYNEQVYLHSLQYTATVLNDPPKDFSDKLLLKMKSRVKRILENTERYISTCSTTTLPTVDAGLKEGSKVMVDPSQLPENSSINEDGLVEPISHGFAVSLKAFIPKFKAVLRDCGVEC